MMFERVLVGYDGSGRSEDALALAHAFAGSPGDITAACAYRNELLTARVSMGAPGGEAAREHALAVLAPLADQGFRTHAAPGASAAAALSDYAEAGAFDLIVLGSTHRGTVGRVLAGATAAQLLHGAPCAVAVAPHGYGRHDPEAISRVGVAYTDTPAGHEALRVAHALADERSGTLIVLDAADRVTVAGEAELTEAVARFAGGAVPIDSRLLLGPPAEQLVACSGTVDLLVMGSRGFGGLRRALLGSVSSQVVREAACPVVVVPRGVHQRSSDHSELTAPAGG